MGNSINDGTVGSGKFRGVPTYAMSPRVTAILMQGEDLPKELRDFYFGIVEPERKFSNTDDQFTQYIRASINCVHHLESPYLDSQKKENENHHLKDFFASEINNCNVEAKGMSQTLQSKDMGFLKTIMSNILRQEQELTTHNYKKKAFGGEREI